MFDEYARGMFVTMHVLNQQYKCNYNNYWLFWKIFCQFH